MNYARGRPLLWACAVLSVWMFFCFMVLPLGVETKKGNILRSPLFCVSSLFYWRLMIFATVKDYREWTPVRLIVYFYYFALMVEFQVEAVGHLHFVAEALLLDFCGVSAAEVQFNVLSCE